MIKRILIATFLILLVFVFSVHSESEKSNTWWKVQSIDTMKYSRDLARQKLGDPSFDSTIDSQIKNIADTGATHVAIDTPYDEEFYSILKRWVRIARKYHLNVWFRGNFAGWEGWFNYPKISRNTHIAKTEKFLTMHKDLFEDGDIFTPCPECENGGPGDPRNNGDIQGFRKLLIDEYKITKKFFSNENLSVISNYDSMNRDVARVVMDKKTTAALDGIVTIDHYVADPSGLEKDIKVIAKETGGKVVLGEFGAPIPDINGEMRESEQASWIREALMNIAQIPELVGVNYWTNIGSTTALWRDDGGEKTAVDAIKSVYKAKVAQGEIMDETGMGIDGAYLTIGNRHFFTDGKGNFEIPNFYGYTNIKVGSLNFYEKEVKLTTSQKQNIILVRQNEDIIFKFRKFLHHILDSSLIKI